MNLTIRSHECHGRGGEVPTPLGCQRESHCGWRGWVSRQLITRGCLGFVHKKTGRKNENPFAYTKEPGGGRLRRKGKRCASEEQKNKLMFSGIPGWWVFCLAEVSRRTKYYLIMGGARSLSKEKIFRAKFLFGS